MRGDLVTLQSPWYVHDELALAGITNTIAAAAVSNVFLLSLADLLSPLFFSNHRHGLDHI